jgi:hypothetical protein
MWAYESPERYSVLRLGLESSRDELLKNEREKVR